MTASRPTRTPGRRRGRAIWFPPAPTSTRLRCTWRSRRAAGRRPALRARRAARVRAGRARVAGCPRRRGDAPDARDGRRPPRAARRRRADDRARPPARLAEARLALRRPWRRGRRAARRLPAVHRRRRLPVPRARPAAGAAPGRRARRAPGDSRQPPGARTAGSTGTGWHVDRRSSARRSTPPRTAVADRHLRRAGHGQDGAHRRHRPRLAGATGIERRRASRSRRRPARRPTASPSCCTPPSARARHAASPARPSRRRGHGLRGGEFRHHENRPLPHAAVIVDEASMVGLALMEQLSRALRARRAPGADRRRRSASRRRASAACSAISSRTARPFG